MLWPPHNTPFHCLLDCFLPPPQAQDSICAAIAEVDGTQFRTDAWTRPGGGGGITRVMQVRSCGATPRSSLLVTSAAARWLPPAASTPPRHPP